MGIDKWIDKKEENGKSSDKDRAKEAKKSIRMNKEEKIKKIREVLKNKTAETQKANLKNKNEYNDEFLNYIVEFKQWLNQRTYLKGDIHKLQTWIKNLYSKMEKPSEEMLEAEFKDKKDQLKEDLKLIPPDFVEEKIRLAVSKKIHARKRNSSDNYYLRKLKKIIREKLKEVRYYQILKEILETF